MTPEPDRMAQEIVRALRRIMRSMDISSRKLIAAHGLSIPQLLCLQHLREFGPLTSGALAKTMALSPPTVTGILDRMEMRGLVHRERRPEDKRRVLVALTQTGRNLADDTPSSLNDQLAQALAELPSQDSAAIHDAIAKLERMIGETNAIPPETHEEY